MPNIYPTDDLPIIALQTMRDQLILGVGTADATYIYNVLSNETNVENLIRLYSHSSNTLNILFQSIDILTNHCNAAPITSHVLGLIYLHCSKQLDYKTKVAILNIMGKNEQELMNSSKVANDTPYYSEGIKRQRLETNQDIENDYDILAWSPSHFKKHDLEQGETPHPKRQKVKLFSSRSTPDNLFKKQQRVMSSSKRMRTSQ